tara:strand:- start:759 stop:2423 length:1665 start_codon:yes stop_codon:yes gene_type:complete
MATPTTTLVDNDPIKKDFRKFLWIVWSTLNLPDPTPIQYDMGSYLQTGPRRCVVEAFRGIGKSWITSAYVVWLLYCDPQHKILVVSASKERADAFSTFTKRLINEIELLTHLRTKNGQRDSVIAFDVGPSLPDHSPSVKSVGINGQLTGSRANTIIADDVEVSNNSATQTMRDKLSEAIKEFDAVLKPNGRVIYLGTPQTEMSIYNLLPERGYEIRIWPSRYPTDKQAAMYQGRLAPFIEHRRADQQGMPTEPDRFTKIDLMEREASYGKAGFALQFMLDTTLSDADKYPLKLADLCVAALNPRKGWADLAWASGPAQIVQDVPVVGFTGDKFYRPMWFSDEMYEYTGAVLAIDPSGRGKDETAYAVVKMLNGYLYATQCGGFKGGYDDLTLTKLANLAKIEKVNMIVVESNFGDGMFSKLLAPFVNKAHPVSIEEVRHNTQKEVRIIDTLEPVMMQHRLIIDEKLIKEDYESAPEPSYSLFYQMTRLTKDRGAIIHDDRLEALAMAVNYWTEQMDADSETIAAQQKLDAFNGEIQKFIDQAVGGGKSVGDKWF